MTGGNKRPSTHRNQQRAIPGGPIKKFQPKYANVYVTIQGHGLSAGARLHYVTANGVRNGLGEIVTCPYLGLCLALTESGQRPYITETMHSALNL